jgi:hypothetical protein
MREDTLFQLKSALNPETPSEKKRDERVKNGRKTIEQTNKNDAF